MDWANVNALFAWHLFPASFSGCIRLPYEKARKFFSICNVGDEVQIVH